MSAHTWHLWFAALLLAALLIGALVLAAPEASGL
jgi:hypothetical protein